MTTLLGLNDDTEWSPKTLKNVEDFLINPTEPILTIYFVGDTLTSELNFPSTPVHGLTYFVRQDKEIFHPHSFHKRVIFGTSNDHIEATILKLMTALAPSYFAITTMPDSILC